MRPRQRTGVGGTEVLPDELLGSILGLVGLSEGPSLTLVCKRWRRIVFKEASFWQQFRLMPCPAGAGAGLPWLPGKLALLRRVAAHVRKLSVLGGPAGWRLEGSGGGSDSETNDPSLAAVLTECFPAPASGLTQLVITSVAQPLPTCAAGAIRQLPRLAGLALEAGSLPAAPALGAMLGGLPALGTLLLSSQGAPLPPGLVDAVVTHAPRLTALELSTGAAPLPPAATLDQLTQLSCLSWLTLVDGRQRAAADPLPLPPPASFPALEGFEYRAAGLLQLAGARMLQCSWKRQRGDLGWLGGPPAGAGADAPCRQLTLGGVLEMPSLPDVLAAARPRGIGAPPPDSLLLFACRLEAGALAGAGPHLSSLSELAVGRCQWSDAEAGLGALLALAPRLESLTLMDCPQGGSLPACVRDRRGLHHLLLPGSGLSHLPPGPYLETLQYLSAGRGCSFPALPAAIAGAPALLYLDLRGSTQLALTADDVALLASMPRLVRLVAPTERTPARVLRALRRAAPHLLVGLPGELPGPAA